MSDDADEVGAEVGASEESAEGTEGRDLVLWWYILDERGATRIECGRGVPVGGYVSPDGVQKRIVNAIKNTLLFAALGQEGGFSSGVRGDISLQHAFDSIGVWIAEDYIEYDRAYHEYETVELHWTRYGDVTTFGHLTMSVHDLLAAASEAERTFLRQEVGRDRQHNRRRSQ